MTRTRYAAAATVVMCATVAAPASAQVLDAVYRGTLVCGSLPFASGKQREAIEVTIAAGAVSYSHVVRLDNTDVEATPERGSGSLSGQKLELQGSWQGAGHAYQANYSGSFVRRSAKLSGTQTWTEGGKTVKRECSGSIKRPLKPLLPKGKKPA